MRVIDDRIELFTNNERWCRLGIIRDSDEDYVVFIDRFTGKVYIEQVVYKNVRIKNIGCFSTTDLRKVENEDQWIRLIKFAQKHGILTSSREVDLCGPRARVWSVKRTGT